MYSITRYLIAAAGFLAVVSSGALVLGHNMGALMRFRCMQMMQGPGEHPNDQWKR